MTIEESLRETLQNGENKGQINAVVDEVYTLCDRYVDPPYKQAVVTKMMHCCYNFAGAVCVMRDCVREDALQRALRRQYLHGVLSGALWLYSAIMVLQFLVVLFSEYAT